MTNPYQPPESEPDETPQNKRSVDRRATVVLMLMGMYFLVTSSVIIGYAIHASGSLALGVAVGVIIIACAMAVLTVRHDGGQK